MNLAPPNAPLTHIPGRDHGPGQAHSQSPHLLWQGQHMDYQAQAAAETGPRGWLRKGAWRDDQKGLVSSGKSGENSDRVKYVLILKKLKQNKKEEKKSTNQTQIKSRCEICCEMILEKFLHFSA